MTPALSLTWPAAHGLLVCYGHRPIVSDTVQSNNISKVLLAGLLLLQVACVPIPLPEPQHKPLPEPSNPWLRPQYCIHFDDDDQPLALGSQWTLIALPLTSLEVEHPGEWLRDSLTRRAALVGAGVDFGGCHQDHSYELSDLELHLSAYDLLLTRVIRANVSVVVTTQAGISRRMTASSTKLMLFPFPKALARELSAVLGTLSDRVLALGLPERPS